MTNYILPNRETREKCREEFELITDSAIQQMLNVCHNKVIDSIKKGLHSCLVKDFTHLENFPKEVAYQIVLSVVEKIKELPDYEVELQGNFTGEYGLASEIGINILFFDKTEEEYLEWIIKKLNLEKNGIVVIDVYSMFSLLKIEKLPKKMIQKIIIRLTEEYGLEVYYNNVWRLEIHSK